MASLNNGKGCRASDCARAQAGFSAGCGERTLLDVPDGMRACIRTLSGEHGLRSRLYSLGFVPGAEVTMQARGATGCRVRICGASLILDGESANSIMCGDAVSAQEATENGSVLHLPDPF